MAAESSLNDLMSALSRWEFAEYLSLFAVIVGVAGESIHELTNWFKTRLWWKEYGGKASALFLISALAAEITTTINANSVSGLVIAFLGDQEAETRLRAAQLEKEAQTLEAIVAGRQLTASQTDAVHRDMKRFAGERIFLVSQVGDAEAFRFGLQIRAALTPEIDVVNRLGSGTIVGNSSAFIGAAISGPDSSRAFMDALAKSLNDQGAFGFVVNVAPPTFHVEGATIGMNIGIRPL